MKPKSCSMPVQPALPLFSTPPAAGTVAAEPIEAPVTPRTGWSSRPPRLTPEKRCGWCGKVHRLGGCAS